MDTRDLLLVSSIAVDNASKLYWAGTVYALANPKTRHVGKAMLSYGVRVAGNVAMQTAKGTVKGVMATPLRRGGKAPAKYLAGFSAKRVAGKAGSKAVPVIGQVLLAYDLALIGGYTYKHVMLPKGREKQGKYLMSGFQA